MTPLDDIRARRDAHEPEILTLEEAAELLRLESPRWLQRSRCPRIRVGGKVRYDRAVVLAWFRSYSDAQAA